MTTPAETPTVYVVRNRLGDPVVFSDAEAAAAYVDTVSEGLRGHVYPCRVYDGGLGEPVEVTTAAVQVLTDGRIVVLRNDSYPVYPGVDLDEDEVEAYRVESTLTPVDPSVITVAYLLAGRSTDGAALRTRISREAAAFSEEVRARQASPEAVEARADLDAATEVLIGTPVEPTPEDLAAAGAQA